jgi:carboxyl-terminal processing protease
MTASFALLLLFGRTAPSPDFAGLWNKVAGAIEEHYYARQTHKSEMNRLLAKYKPVALEAKTEDAFESAVNRMCQEFTDSHFEFFSQSDQGYYVMDGLGNWPGKEMPEIGAWFKRTPEGYVVSMVLNDSSAQKAHLRKGDRILSVDGRPFSPVDSFRGKVRESVRLEVARGSDRFSATVTPESEPALRMFLNATKASEKIIEDEDRRIGYIHLWTQANDGFKSALSEAVYGRFAGTDGMILDLRDGFGGGFDGYGDPFFRPQVPITMAGGTHPFGYQKPLIVLINGGSRSAKEMLADIFKLGKRAKLIGSRTAGNVLAAIPLNLTSWAYLEVPAVDIQVDGVRLEKNGVAPDIEVPREFDDAGNDLYLEKALHELRTMIPSKKTKTHE